MTLYQPMNGWDGNIAVAIPGDTSFSDASEMYSISFEENHNPERRKQLGTRSPGYLPGKYEASGSCAGYFITGEMVSKMYGVDDTSAKRDHAERGMVQFNIKIDFSAFPIKVKEAGPIYLTGYLLSGCLLETDSFKLEEGSYVEKTFNFSIQKIYDIYDSDTDEDLEPFII